MDEEVALLVRGWRTAFVNAGLAVAAVVMAAPGSTAVDLVLRNSGLGEGSLPQVGFIEWLSMLAPYLIILGLVSAVPVIVIVTAVRPPVRWHALGLSVAIGGLIFASLAALPSLTSTGFVWRTFISGFLISLPIWVVLGLILRLPARR